MERNSTDKLGWGDGITSAVMYFAEQLSANSVQLRLIMLFICLWGSGDRRCILR